MDITSRKPEDSNWNELNRLLSSSSCKIELLSKSTCIFLKPQKHRKN